MPDDGVGGSTSRQESNENSKEDTHGEQEAKILFKFQVVVSRSGLGIRGRDAAVKR